MATKTLIETEVLFYCSHFDPAIFNVTEFSIDDKLSSLYKVEVEIVSEHLLTSNNIISKKATLFLNREGEFYPYSGIISSFRYIDSTTDNHIYQVTIMPKLWELTLTIQNRIFQKKSDPEIIKEVLDESGLHGYFDMSALKRAAYPQRDYVVQYEESDYDFIIRLMSECGMWFIFRETPLSYDEIGATETEELLVITDNTSTFEVMPEPKLRYRPSSSMVKEQAGRELDCIYEIELCRKLIPEFVVVKNYNYRTPEINLSVKSKVSGGDTGLVYKYGGSYKKIDSAQKYAELLAHREALSQLTASGKSDCKGMRAGNIIEVIEHCRNDLNQKYLVTGIQHVGKKPKGQGLIYTVSYENEFLLLPSDRAVHFRMSPPERQLRIPGVINATIEGGGQEYGAVDEQGRYKVRMPFDLSDSENMQGSKPVRMAQTYSGPDYGMHLPAHENCEMIIAHVNGDPDKPIGLGTVPNTNTTSPVKSNNKNQSAIITAGGNKIVLDDINGSQQFNLHTPFDQSFSSGHNENIKIKADRFITVSNSESKSIKSNQDASVGNNQIINIGGEKDESIKGKISISIDGNRSEKVSSNKNISVTSESMENVLSNILKDVNGDANISLQSTNTVEVGGNVTQNLNSSALAESKATVTLQGKGNVSVDGKNIVINGISSITLVSGGSSVNINPAAIMIVSPAITISGNKVTIKGLLNKMAAGLIKIN